MKLFVSYKADHIEDKVQRASVADHPEDVARITQEVERGARTWASWAESHGGRTISSQGHEGKVEIEADYLSELAGIKEQYEGAVESSSSVGVGTKLSEADRSLKAAAKKGGDRIMLYTEEVDEILDEKDEKELAKAQPGMNPGAGAGFAGASMSTPAQPQAPREASEHSENEALRSEIKNAPQPAQAPVQAKPEDYEEMFHQLAAQQQQAQAGQADEKPPGVVDGVRSQVVAVLQQIKANAPMLEKMKASNPELYESITGAVQAMIAMAQAQLGVQPGQPEQGQGEEVQKAEGKVGQCKWKLGERRCLRQVSGDYCHSHKDHWANKINRLKALQADTELDKAALEAGKTGRHQVLLPVGSQIDAGPSSNHKSGQLKVQDPATGKTKWRSVRAGVVMAPDGTPTSSRNPSGS